MGRPNNSTLDGHFSDIYDWGEISTDSTLALGNHFCLISARAFLLLIFLAFTDRYTSRESASVIAKKIKNIVVSDFKGVIHIGGDRKSVYEYALSLGAENIEKISIKDMSVKMPTDTSLDCSLYKQHFNKD